VLIPLSTADARYGDLRVKVTERVGEISRCTFSDFYVQVDSLEYVLPVSEMLREALGHKHSKVDYVVKVPLERLKIAENEEAPAPDHARRDRRDLAARRRIGIMNIMLGDGHGADAEIGIRRALGAKRRHITMQFLIEALILSSVGGLMGVLCGSLGALMITQWVGWPTVIHQWRSS